MHSRLRVRLEQQQQQQQQPFETTGNNGVERIFTAPAAITLDSDVIGCAEAEAEEEERFTGTGFEGDWRVMVKPYQRQPSRSIAIACNAGRGLAKWK
jgi:hypothetical protein